MRVLYVMGLLLPAIRKKSEEVGERVEAQREKLDELLSETRELRDGVRRAAGPGDVVGAAGGKARGCTGT